MATLRPPVTELTDAALAAELRVHADTGHAERLRACQQEAVRRLPVRPLVGGGYVVASRTTSGAWWRVEFDPTEVEPWRCSCPAEVVRCHHVRQVESYCRLVDAIVVRATPAPNVSALVD